MKTKYSSQNHDCVIVADYPAPALERLGFKSEWDYEKEKRDAEKSAAMAAFIDSLQRYKKVCPICNKEYITTNAIQVCCSRFCGIENRRRRGWKRK